MALPQGNFSTITIDNVPYQIKLLEGLVGFRTAKDLGAILLPVVGKSFDASRHDDVFHGAPKTFSEMALLLLQQIDAINIEDIIFNRLLSYLVVNGQAVKLQDLIVGNYGILIDLVAFAIKENYGDLFAGKDLISRFQGVVQQMV